MIYQHTPWRGGGTQTPKSPSNKQDFIILLLSHLLDPLFRGSSIQWRDNLPLMAGLKMLLACLSDAKAHFEVISWGLKDLCRVTSVPAYCKEETVLAYKKKKNNGFLIWFCIQRANCWPQWVSGKASNSFNKARIPNGTSSFQSVKCNLGIQGSRFTKAPVKLWKTKQKWITALDFGWQQLSNIPINIWWQGSWHTVVVNTKK